MSFTARERSRQQSRLNSRGLARDVQTRLSTSRPGRSVTAFVDRHRAELLALLVSDGDTRRATVAALAPIFRGAVTTTDVFERTLSGSDIERLDRLVAVVRERASEPLSGDVAILQALIKGARDRSIGEVLEIAT